MWSLPLRNLLCFLQNYYFLLFFSSKRHLFMLDSNKTCLFAKWESASASGESNLSWAVWFWCIFNFNYMKLSGYFFIYAWHAHAEKWSPVFTANLWHLGANLHSARGRLKVYFRFKLTLFTHKSLRWNKLRVKRVYFYFQRMLRGVFLTLDRR